MWEQFYVLHDTVNVHIRSRSDVAYTALLAVHELTNNLLAYPIVEINTEEIENTVEDANKARKKTSDLQNNNEL